MIGAFHFLRPLWLLGLLAAAALGWIVRHRGDMRAKWRGVIAPQLLDALLVDRRTAHRLRPVHLTVALIALGAVAAAGPSWKQEASPFLEDKAPLAIAIDLSQTMDATDVTPTRLERAKLKVRDLLALRPGGRTALFAYAGSAHMVLPLTEDANLVATYVDALATRIMPVPGRDTAGALRVVEQGLARESVPGTILFLTDGVEPAAFDAFRHKAGQNEIMVLGVGTPDGGPVRTGAGSYLTDASGARVFSRLDVEGLQRLKRDAGIGLATVTADDADVRWVTRQAQSHLQQAQAGQDSRWRDAGWWLVIPLSVFGALWFRRGWTIRWTAALLLVMSGPALADPDWMAPWLTPDQQGRLAFERGDVGRATERFEKPMWKGVAAYRAGRFAEAVDAFARLDTAEADYDQASALAHLGRLEPAVLSLQQALRKRPGWPAAAVNLGVLQDALTRRKKDDEAQAEAPNQKPDQVQFDEKGKQGKAGQVNAGEQTVEMWMRNIQTTPTDLLARRFAIETRGRAQ